MKPGMRPVLPSALSFTVLALSANWLDWKSLFRLNVQFPRLVVHAQRAFMFRGEWYQIAVGVAFLADFRVHIRIAGVDGNVIKRWRYRTQIVTCLRFQPGMARFATCSDGVVGLVESY